MCMMIKIKFKRDKNSEWEYGWFVETEREVLDSNNNIVKTINEGCFCDDYKIS